MDTDKLGYIKELFDELYILGEKKYQEGKLSHLDICKYEDICMTANRIINIPGLNIYEMDPRFLVHVFKLLPYIVEIKCKKVWLRELQIMDDDGQNSLPNSQRVRALRGELDYSKTWCRNSNYMGQNNLSRLMDNLENIKKNGYPIHNEYLYVEKEKNIIIDGWHRASVLYYLFGNIEIDIRTVELSHIGFDFTAEYFPINRIKKGSTILIVEMDSNIAHKYIGYINSSHYAQIIDRLYSFDNILLHDNFKYIVIASSNWDEKQYIKRQLTQLGIDEKRVII